MQKLLTSTNLRILSPLSQFKKNNLHFFFFILFLGSSYTIIEATVLEQQMPPCETIFYGSDEDKKITRHRELQSRGQTIILIQTKLIIWKISTAIQEQEVGHLKWIFFFLTVTHTLTLIATKIRSSRQPHTLFRKKCKSHARVICDPLGKLIQIFRSLEVINMDCQTQTDFKIFISVKSFFCPRQKQERIIHKISSL